MSEELRSIVLGTAGLAFAAILALALSLSRRTLHASPAQVRTAVRVALLALLLQLAHFAEELVTGFPREFPVLLGLPPWSLRFFVAFNLFWLVLWSLSLGALRARRRAPGFPLWFLGIAAVANGFAHPLLAFRAGGYFPGVLTAPLVGMAGGWLLRHLVLLTGEGSIRSRAMARGG